MQPKGKKKTNRLPKEKQFIIYATFQTSRNKLRNHNHPQKSNTFLQTDNTENSGQTIFYCHLQPFKKAELVIYCS